MFLDSILGNGFCIYMYLSISNMRNFIILFTKKVEMFFGHKTVYCFYDGRSSLCSVFPDWMNWVVLYLLELKQKMFFWYKNSRPILFLWSVEALLFVAGSSSALVSLVLRCHHVSACQHSSSGIAANHINPPQFNSQYISIWMLLLTAWLIVLRLFITH